MGEIENQKTARCFSLLSRFLVGRGDGCELRIDDQRVSGEHASLYFDGRSWVVRDLMSRNGTSVNGVAVGGGGRRVLSQGDVVTFGGADSWILVDDCPPENAGIQQTVQATFALEDAGLEFHLSQDEENLDLVLVASSGRLVVPPRAFHFLLLALARARLSDGQRGVVPTEQGYLYSNDLIPILYSDLQKLNVNIHRARKQLDALGARDANALFERRVASNQIRLGMSRLLVTRSGSEDSLQSVYKPH
jgi:hypothetical protein